MLRDDVVSGHPPGRCHNPGLPSSNVSNVVSRLILPTSTATTPAATTAAAGLAAIVASTSFRNFLDLESLSASVAVLTPPAVAYSPQDVRNCTVVASAPGACSLTAREVYGGCPESSGACTVQQQGGQSSGAAAALGACVRWTNHTVSITGGAFGSCAYAAAQAGTDGESITAAAAPVGSVVVAAWEPCAAVACFTPPPPPAPPLPREPPIPKSPWYEQPDLVGAIFGSIAGLILIGTGALVVVMRRRAADRRGMMLDQYALNTVDPTAPQDLDVYGNKQDAEGEEVLFMVNPGMRL
mmetsp:Transcript_21265/g.52514  ORF Transcript_21265/g.52514 Transcript_21265/m.52514 type:complete len:297 (-) Transcript_21265:384-1274(-)